MGLLGNSSPFDADVEKATSENYESEDWALIMDICDKVGSSSNNAKDCLRAILKRLRNPDPHIALQAMTLLDACVNNCGKNFHLEIASRDFEAEYRKLLSKYQGAVALKFKGLLKKWCEGEFKSDPQLSLIPSLMNKLKSEGVEFVDATDVPTKKRDHSSKSHYSSSGHSSWLQKEKDDIEKAIELSLQESKQSSPSPRNTGASSSAPSTSLYPSMSQLSTAPPPEPMKVRALYDFEAAEDNELTFLAGEIIHVSDSSDKNWWKGYNQRGEGLFPANFVTTDLSVDPQVQKTSERKSVQFNDSVEVKNIERSNSPEPESVEINEAKIDRLISLLHEANPEDSSKDTQEMLYLENEVNKMGPLIDMELEKIDRKLAHLTQLSKDLVDALNLYHTLMREPSHVQPPQGQYPPQMPPHMMYNGTSVYGPMTHMPPFYTQAHHQPVVGPPSSMPPGVMTSGPAGMMPPHQQHQPPPMGMGPPHGMLQHQPQQMPPGHMGQMNPMPQMPTPGAPPPQTPQQQHHQPVVSHPSFAPVPQPSGPPPSVGLYHQAPPGHSQSFVM